MPANPYIAFTLANKARETGAELLNGLKRIRDIPSTADSIASARFPDSARDMSTQNAFRHSLGTGMLAQEFGAGYGGIRGAVAEGAAKGIGYLWEGLGAADYISSPKHRLDTKHDLTANAVGARAAGITKNQEELINFLDKAARKAVVTDSPSEIYEPSPLYLTRSVK